MQLVTIYDLKITCAWEGTLEDGTAVKGNVTAVEVSHDMDQDDYVFETEFEDAATHTNNKEAQALKEDVRTKLTKGLRSKFQQFPKAMIETHGRDLLAAAAAADAASPASSGASSINSSASIINSTVESSSGTHISSKPIVASEKKPAKSISTSKVKCEGDFMAVSICQVHEAMQI